MNLDRLNAAIREFPFFVFVTPIGLPEGPYKERLMGLRRHQTGDCIIWFQSNNDTIVLRQMGQDDDDYWREVRRGPDDEEYVDFNGPRYEVRNFNPSCIAK